MSRNLYIQHLRGVRANLPVLDPGEEYLCTDTFEVFIGTPSNGNIAVRIPIFNAAGVRQSNMHAIVDRVTATGSTQTITLVGSAAFTSATSYVVVVTDNIVKRTLNVVQTSGTSFAISGCSSGDLLTYICFGN